MLEWGRALSWLRRLVHPPQPQEYEMDALAPWHIVVIAVVAAVLFFGWKQLPDMSRSLGRSLRIFKTELKGIAADAAPAQPLTETVDAPVVPPVVTGRPVAVVETLRPQPFVTSQLDR